jgi:REP element-mobilizing transposase RayT
MDQGLGECIFSQHEHCSELKRCILHFQNQRYFVGSFVIMPNHCYLLIRPTDGHKLEDLIGSIKGVTSRSINKARNTVGSIWQNESYDQIVRDTEHLYRVVQYIGNNPRKAGLSQSKWHRFVHPQWEACGWGFREP